MIIVTGGAGFIGSNIVAALNAGGREDVVVADNRDAPGNGNLRPLRLRERLSPGELPAFLTRRAADVEAIIHMGACSDTTQTDRAFMMANNFEYTQQLWNFCAVHGTRFIYASSAATYGDGSAGYDDTLDPRRLQPLNLYGESKQRFDLFTLEQTRAPAAWAGLKFFNVYGPREAHKGRMASVAFHALWQARQTGTVKLFKSARPDCPDGGQQRDFVYVGDAVAAVLHFLAAPPEKMNALFNVGTGQARTFADLARAAFGALGLESRIEYIPMPEDLEGKYQYFTQATTAKLRASGFTQPFATLEEGVRACARENSRE